MYRLRGFVDGTLSGLRLRLRPLPHRRRCRPRRL